MRLNNIRRDWGILPLALVLLFAITACDDSSTTPAGQAVVSVLLTDAAGDVDEAWVNIGSIYLQGGSCGSDDASDGDGGEGGCGRVWLRDTPTGWIELTGLSAQVQPLVDDAIVPAGSYAQLRFVIEEAVIVTEGLSVFATPKADMEALNAHRGGEPLVPTGALHCPSCGSSGLKVKFHDGFIVFDDGETIVVADFDVGQSFGRERGNSGRWVMRPLIRASRMALVGGVAGTVALEDGLEPPATCGANAIGLSIFMPIAVDSDGGIWTGHTSEDGSFTIQPLLPGSYDLSYEPEIDFEDGSVVTFNASADPSSAEVEAGTVVTANYTIDDVQCSPPNGGI